MVQWIKKLFCCFRPDTFSQMSQNAIGDPGFPRRGRQLLFGQVVPSAWKWKKSNRGRTFQAPPDPPNGTKGISCKKLFSARVVRNWKMTLLGIHKFKIVFSELLLQAGHLHKCILWTKRNNCLHSNVKGLWRAWRLINQPSFTHS